ncbi:MAG: ribonuclease HII [Lentisphaeria bacterium]|nr:ribonuclease HII [Lentisphaeria bacterium]
MTEYLKKNDELLANELKLAGEGFSFVAGVDEVGRGPLAGPVVAAAVVITDLEKVPQVFDSKGLSEKKREELDAELRANPAIKFAISEVSPEVIDEINILQATHLAMRQAVKTLEQELGKIDFVLIDGRPVKSMPYNNLAIVKGDQKSASIAAASIIAKVYRDKLMCDYDKIYPGYGFAEHKGYGTKQHLIAINELGACPIHRKSFSPIKELLNPPTAIQEELW